MCAGIFCEDDPKVSDLLFDFDLWCLLGVWVWCAVLRVEVDWSRGVLPDEFALACVEFEVVECSCGLDESEDFLASCCCAGEDDGVVGVCQVP